MNFQKQAEAMLTHIENSLKTWRQELINILALYLDNAVSKELERCINLSYRTIPSGILVIMEVDGELIALGIVSKDRKSEIESVIRAIEKFKE